MQVLYINFEKKKYFPHAKHYLLNINIVNLINCHENS